MSFNLTFVGGELPQLRLFTIQSMKVVSLVYTPGYPASAHLTTQGHSQEDNKEGCLDSAPVSKADDTDEKPTSDTFIVQHQGSATVPLKWPIIITDLSVMDLCCNVDIRGDTSFGRATIV